MKYTAITMLRMGPKPEAGIFSNIKIHFDQKSATKKTDIFVDLQARRLIHQQTIHSEEQG